MAKNKPILYEKYPLWMVFVFNLAMLLVYLAGAYIMFRLHLITGILYIIYLIFIEASVYREGCKYCYYYGKRCVAGKGLLAPVFVKKGNPKKFCERTLSFKDFIPQLLVVLIPFIVGIALLISRGFHVLTLIAVIYPVFSWIAVNPVIYGKLACNHCKQGNKCCPALDFFMKKGKKN
ncbi:hypothetical protein KY348_02245 [Candidatus Woesearchaeota archaeon]|nr:hypothetical protein [Candidatus Woesearchaeota archaeon]